MQVHAAFYLLCESFSLGYECIPDFVMRGENAAGPSVCLTAGRPW